MGGFTAKETGTLRSCAAKRTPKDVFITTWPELVWNEVQGLGSRPREGPLFPKAKTYHQDTGGYKDASMTQPLSPLAPEQAALRRATYW